VTSRVDSSEATHKRRFANYVRTVLSILFGWGVERGHIETNPAYGIKNIRRPRASPPGIRDGPP
jgi:hypothetical protein